MKKGFTLVELLIVVVVLVTLMSMTFKLSFISGSSQARNVTVSNLQKLENCLSGYYAAFGTYPPVGLHGSRNPYLRVSSHGIQNLDGTENRSIFGWDTEKFRRGEYDSNEEAAWRQVEAACKAQPVDCQYPYPSGYGDLVDAYSEKLRDDIENGASVSDERKAIFLQGFDDGVTKNIGRFGSYQDKVEWRDLQLFKFGLLSYLLPRYLIMMRSEDSLYEDYAQWTSNNTLPSNPMTGFKYTSWREVCRRSTSKQKTDIAQIANIPSQAVCARWIPNLSRIITTAHYLKVFGVELQRWNDDGGGFSTETTQIYSPGSFDNDSTSGQYVLDGCSVRDGWENDFYYYSLPPYQSYTLWSAGPNKRTFPPWISRETLDSSANACVGAWIEDDIVNMSH